MQVQDLPLPLRLSHPHPISRVGWAELGCCHNCLAKIPSKFISFGTETITTPSSIQMIQKWPPGRPDGNALAGSVQLGVLAHWEG